MKTFYDCNVWSLDKLIIGAENMKRNDEQEEDKWQDEDNKSAQTLTITANFEWLSELK